MRGSRAAIPAPTEGGEIGRLGANMKTLHDSVAASLRQVREISWTDPMTGISNRARFNALSAAMAEEAARAGSELTLLFFDLDNFKWVNDKYGHEHGDALLKAVATATGAMLEHLAQERRETTPLFARLSGEEFAIIVRSGPAGGVPDAIAASILSLFKDGFRVEGQAYPVAADLAQLMAGADAAMYQAKAAGKSTLAWFSQSLAETSRRLRLIEEELKALDPAEEFRLVYMPIIDRAGAVVACEALLRWRSPVLGDRDRAHRDLRDRPHAADARGRPGAPRSGLSRRDRRFRGRLHLDPADPRIPGGHDQARPGDRRTPHRVRHRGSLRSIIGFCHAQRMTVTAEGVDHPARLERLREAGCDFFQRFGISPPLRLEDLAHWRSGREHARGQGDRERRAPAAPGPDRPVAEAAASGIAAGHPDRPQKR